MRLGFLKDRLSKGKTGSRTGRENSHSHDFSLMMNYMGFHSLHSVVFSFFLHSRVIFLA